MSALENKLNLLDYGESALEELVVGWGEPRYRARQLIKWIHQSGLTDFDEMSNLSKSFRAKLVAKAEVSVLETALERVSDDGTRKWLFRLKDGNAIETVFIPEAGRGTLCVSSQVGCALNCSFCSTGKEGFNRNLTLGEIIGQVWQAVHTLSALDDDYKVTNVVMMGMGEPLLNYDPVVEAMKLMLLDNAYGLSKYRVTLSTSGVIPAMLRLREDIPVALAVSLHAGNNALRNELVPVNKKYPLEQLIPLCRDYYPKNSKRMVTFEYVMLEGVNDRPEDARELIALLSDVSCKVNLIPFNAFPKTRYQCSSESVINAFQRQLMAADIQTWRRKTRGDDIDGACGQLAGNIQDRTGRNARWQRTGRLVQEPKDKAL